MDENQITKQKYSLSFHGTGSNYFGIIIINWLLTTLTLGFYYPWAKAKNLQFIYGSTALNNDRFTFHGTGSEMFRGFIKAILFFAIAFIVYILLVISHFPLIGIIVLYSFMLAITPIAIHGSYKYRMSRTSWRGIRFGYRGDRKELTTNFFKWLLFTILTFGIYGSWFVINLRNYILSNIRFGNVKFKYEGSGGEYFFLNLKGYFFTILTLGIYLFWWQKDLFNYYIDNLSIHNNDQKINFKSTATGGGFFGLLIVNLLITIFTLGFGYAWVVTRTLNFVIQNIELEGDIDLNTLIQTEENYKDATGEDVSDFLDLDFII